MDKQYSYGCYPWYLNEWINIEIVEAISSEVSLYGKH